MDTLAKPGNSRNQQPGGNVGSVAGGVANGVGTVDAAHVARLLNEIKGYMPETYKCIQAKAAPEQLGAAAFGLVRRGLRGEPNCFYASEGGRTVGTPFVQLDGGIMADVALAMVCFGARFWVVWQQPATPATGQAVH